jgi:PAS domain S-box-containing protein
MVVEDEAIIALDIQRQLTNAGFSVAGKAQTAEGAFQQIERENPDIVLMDIRLKGKMDGVQAASIIRSRYALPVIFLTAHADGPTLQRAQDTEPFGYLVKPLADANVKATITMALHKHRMERERENSRKLLSAILHGLPDVVVVARPSGEILFLNHVAERITGWSLREAAGKSILEVAAVESHDGNPVTTDLLLQLGGEGSTPTRIPPQSVLTTKDGRKIDIAGHLSLMSVDGRPAGVFVTLQDITSQNSEDRRVRQEQQMLIASELAHGVALEFYTLFGLIDDAVNTISNSADKDTVDLIRKASKSGSAMATQLAELREGNGTAHIVNVTQYLRAGHTLLQGVCGKGVKLSIEAELDVGYILSTGNHFEQLIVNLVLEGKHKLEGPGELTIGADIHTQAVSPSKVGSYVRLSLKAEKSSKAGIAREASLRALTELPRVGLAIVRTIAIASGGFTRLTEPSDTICLIEVFLPRHESRLAAAAAANECSQMILTVAFPESLIETVRANFDQDVMLLGAGSPEEASWISELYEGDIDLVVVSKSCAQTEEMDGARDRMRARRPHAAFLESDFAGDSSEPFELTEMLKDFLRSKPVSASRSADAAP